MSINAVADTHTILWYLYNDHRLSIAAQDLIDASEIAGEQIAIASITLAEIVYLVEKKRIDIFAFEETTRLLKHPNSPLVEVPFDLDIADTMRRIDRKQIPELPDRIIAATALYFGVPVISKDHKIVSSIVETVWY